MAEHGIPHRHLSRYTRSQVHLPLSASLLPRNKGGHIRSGSNAYTISPSPHHAAPQKKTGRIWHLAVKILYA